MGARVTGRISPLLVTSRAVLLGTLATALTAAPALADEGHDHGASAAAGLDPTTLLWALLSLGGLLAALVGVRAAVASRMTSAAATGERPIGYLAAIRQFSRNAKLFLSYSLMAELGTGIWSVLFNLYLLRAGYPISFIGTFWLVNMLCHGISALPAGVIADRYGRRRAFFIATGVSLAAQGSLLFTVDPTMILVLAGVAGFGEAFHGVTGAPFMMENSEPRERPHLFSLNSSFLQGSRFVGSFTGGLLPLAWAGLVGIPPVTPEAARWALVTGLPLTAIALVPLAFMRTAEVEEPASLKEIVLLRNVVNLGIIARFTALSLMVGTGFGLTVRFFNVFFEQVHSATDSQIGTILGFAAIAGAASILVAPVLAQQFGKAKSIFVTQSLSVPFLLALAVVPSMQLITVIFLARGAIYSIAQPLRTQLSMEFITSRERGTAAGFTHAAFDMGGGVGAGVAGFLIGDTGFLINFTAAAVLIAVPAYLYYAFFAPLEARARAQAPVTEGRTPATPEPRMATASAGRAGEAN
ncbi:MAG: MFS transporter [Chloroflexi bacterium]|nr:MFS transporter [Chloroflexota bacterium]